MNNPETMISPGVVMPANETFSLVDIVTLLAEAQLASMRRGTTQPYPTDDESGATETSVTTEERILRNMRSAVVAEERIARKVRRMVIAEAQAGKLPVRRRECHIDCRYDPSNPDNCIVTRKDLKNWLTGHGYKIVGLDPIPSEGTGVMTVPVAPVDHTWVAIARRYADEEAKSRKAMGCGVSACSIAKDVARRMKQEDVVGTRGKVLDSETIRRHALRGWKPPAN